ncbi:alpha/beta fold hydrolase [Pseudomonas sp. Milli4]|uniref:Alpha/beta fold hydrolase n=1 Tax=Pseudomonas schmalbachii TaxID=2816993 RepID=A0ABS3TWQ7_9PSED|nr:alpha/beta fold hydrolase [Pseudomonas schmalbachii]
MVKRSLNGFEYVTTSGPRPGVTPRTLLHRRGTLSLYRYHPSVDEIYRVPVLLVTPTTNSASIFDLAKGQSLVEFLLGRGYDVYVMDWNAPTAAESGLRIEDYVLDFIPDSIRRIQADTGEQEVSLIGYCMAGVLSTIYAALHPEGPLKNLVLFTTPTDWSKVVFKKLAAGVQVEPQRMVDSNGLVPADTITRTIDMIRPASRIAGHIRLLDNLWNDDYVHAYRLMMNFGAETIPLAGAYHRQITSELMEKNSLVQGTMRIGGRQVDLKNIRVPLLHVIAQYDHMVPPDCAQPLVAGVSSEDKEELMLPGGHLSLVTGPSAVKRMWPKLDQWLGNRSI